MQQGSNQSRNENNWIQRMIAMFLLVMLSPVLLVLLIVVKLDSPGPFIFKQSRPGYLGRNFTAYKIRSMSTGSEYKTRLGVTQSDPRITRVGRLLRSTKLDEIPQLFNIVKGEMCFVGPRPIPLALDTELRSKIPGFESRYQVPPGVTSLAQICVNDNGVDEQLVHDWRERFEAEIRYTRLRCAWYDLIVVALTGLYIVRKVVK